MSNRDCTTVHWGKKRAVDPQAGSALSKRTGAPGRVGHEAWLGTQVRGRRSNCLHSSSAWHDQSPAVGMRYCHTCFPPGPCREARAGHDVSETTVRTVALARRLKVDEIYGII